MLSEILKGVIHTSAGVSATNDESAGVNFREYLTIKRKPRKKSDPERELTRIYRIKEDTGKIREKQTSKREIWH